jgi:crotonobetainyl-CoA:carnitine CoA-transferase CaiB-like acyl-CoA transferase
MSVLNGYRVLDFGRFIAGPYCATLLADFGAEVIRIEKVDGSEDRYMNPVAEDDSGALFLQVNRNKRGMTLNPTRPAGREIVEKLVRTADVVVANLPPRGLKAIGLDYDTLKEIKPDIILTTVSAFGRGGPYSERVGFDGLGQGMSGGPYLAGVPGAPARDVLPVVDFGTAMSTAYGTLAALLHREKTGQGQMVEGALLRTALTYSNSYLIEQSVKKRDRVGTGNRSQLSGPSDILKVRDGWIMVQVVGQPLYERWVKMIGRPELLDDPRFRTDLDRGDNGEELSRIAGEHVRDMTVVEALAAYEQAMVPAGPLLSPQQTLEDPHVNEIGYLQPHDYPGLASPAPLAVTPVHLTDSDAEIRHRAPTLGEHTDEIMAELGYDEAMIAQLRGERVI